jgi:Fe-S cluster biogenesis protein NfuA
VAVFTVSGFGSAAEREARMQDPAARGIQMAVDQVNRLLAKDGGRLTVVERQGTTLLVRVEAAPSAECPTCAVGADAALMLLRGALARQAPMITQVSLSA